MSTQTIIQGDCLEVMRTFPDKSFDLLVTDPPYGIRISSNPFRQKFEKENWDDAVPSEATFSEMFRISKNQVIWGGNYFGLPPTRGFFIWDKKQSENFSSAMCEFAWSSRNAPAKIFRKHAASFPKFHPTTKPLDLIEWVIRWFPETKSVIDPFLGSGTTLLASKRLGKDAVGIEISQRYCDIARKRLAEPSDTGIENGRPYQQHALGI